jgi:beta-glucosidase
MINAIQQHGIASFPKHLVVNDMEHERTRVNCVISDRALREIYLHPFQIAIREAQPWGLMTAYNKVNGCHMSENAQLIGALLRDEWKWEGVVTSDWYGTYSTSKAINAGLDLEMPGPSEWRGALLNRAVSCGKVMESTVDRSAARLTSQSAIPESAPESTLDTRDTIELLKEVSVESIVLLKNENELLPLNPSRSVSSGGTLNESELIPVSRLL